MGLHRIQFAALGVAATAATLLVTHVETAAAQIPVDAVVHFGPPHPQPLPGNHVLVPDEVTIRKGGTVTFQVNGGGHGVAIYPVSTKTMRTDIEADLCANGPGGPCIGGTAFPHHSITDAKDDVIVDIEAFAGIPFFDYAPGRLLGAIGGSALFLNGSTAAPVPPATVSAPGVRLVHRFQKAGRYLVICMNRFHAINDHMFGFVNVVGGEDDDDITTIEGSEVRSEALSGCSRFWTGRDRASSKLAEQPRPRQRPVAHDGVARDVEHVGNLFDTKAAEEAELDHLAASGIEFSQTLQRLVERHQVLASFRRCDPCLVEADGRRAAATFLIAA
jgi:plastocyanin